MGTMRPHISSKSSKVKFVKALKIANVAFMVLGKSHTNILIYIMLAFILHFIGVK